MRELLLVNTLDDVERHIDQVRKAAEKAHQWIAEQSDKPLEFLRVVKFEPLGYHPVSHDRLNIIEQVNQTWTYLVALEATRFLLKEHSHAGGFRLAPGAHASQALDIMSVEEELVGAETFAATSPQSNDKLKRDFAKLAKRPEQHRYVFFTSPAYGHRVRQYKYEHPGVNDIQIWSIVP